MSEPLRHDKGSQFDGDGSVDQDKKIEQLLLRGLDHYFAADFEQAINVWTRVLFLDRNHARVRAYIERARSAIAERQRESEELLHSGAAAFDRGDVERARHLLSSALDRGAPQHETLSLLERLNRLDASEAAASVPLVRATPSGILREQKAVRLSGKRWPLLWMAASLVAAAAALVLSAPGSVASLFDPPRGAPAAAAVEDPLPVPSPGEISLARARQLFERGHPYDALRTLDLVRHGDPVRPAAERLRADIQRTLLSDVPPTFVGTSSGSTPSLP